jgi:hypothetical protein
MHADIRRYQDVAIPSQQTDSDAGLSGACMQQF